MSFESTEERLIDFTISKNDRLDNVYQRKERIGETSTVSMFQRDMNSQLPTIKRVINRSSTVLVMYTDTSNSYRIEVPYDKCIDVTQTTGTSTRVDTDLR